MRKNIDKLINLLSAHPDAEVIAMVEHEVVWDDSYSRWIGSIGSAWVDQYYWVDDRVYLKSKDVDELKEDYIDRVYDDYKHECFTDDDWDKLASEYIEGLEWTEAIVVNIDTY